MCDDLWDSANSDVACRQLGFPVAARPTSYRTIAVVQGKVYHLYRVLCDTRRALRYSVLMY